MPRKVAAPNDYAKASRIDSFLSLPGGEPVEKCGECEGHGFVRVVDGRGKYSKSCDECDGRGWHGIKACQPTNAPPGTVEKSAVLQARYAAGQRLWHPDDAGNDSPGVWHRLESATGRPVGSLVGVGPEDEESEFAAAD